MGQRQSTLEIMGMKSTHFPTSFWKGKRVLVTGHSGFKGGWLVLWLYRLGANITGISLHPNTAPNLYDLANIHNFCLSHFCDVRDTNRLASLIKIAQPEIVFHLAAQPLVRESYCSPLETFSTNVMGTAHVLDALRGLSSVSAAVMVTTDKVYRNNEWPWPYRENDLLGGHDPYSASKAASEIVISSYRDAFLAKQGVAVASARAGNVIGGGDWSTDRLIPDAVRAWQSGNPLHIRHPNAIRPWQHVLEPLAGYLVLAASMVGESHLKADDLCSAFNFGPASDSAVSVKDVIELARTAFGGGHVIYRDSNDGPHEAGMLALDVAKARLKLGIKSQWSYAESIQRTMSWYQAYSQGADARALCEADIDTYEALL